MLIVLLRAIILYILVTFSLRLMGKRQLGELQPSELVITILISNIATLSIEDTGIPMILGAIPVLTLVAFEILVSNLSLQFKGFRSFVSGKPIIIISNGVVDQKQLRRLRFSIDDLMESLRQNNIFKLEDVAYAIVETTGTVSVLPTYQAQAITPEMLGLDGKQDDPPVVVISDGKIVKTALSVCNIDEAWILQKLRERGFSNVNQAFLMTVDLCKECYVIKKER